jgi:hypothetical protein
MINFTGGHNNWWAANINLPDNSVNYSFDIAFNHTEVKNMQFQTAADYTAQLIGKKYNNIYLAMSGGLDSAFVAEVLHRNNIPFTPIIARLMPEDGTCNYDYFYAMYWCEQKSITPKVVTYKQNDPCVIKASMKLLKKIKHFSVGVVILDLLEKVEEVNGNLIVGDPVIPRGTNGLEYYNPIGEEFDTDWFAYFVEIFGREKAHPGGFFFYTPELLLAYAQEINLVDNESVAKTKLYNIPYRPKTFPVEFVTQKMLNKLCYLEIPHNSANIKNKSWKKQELIDLLVK